MQVLARWPTAAVSREVQVTGVLLGPEEKFSRVRDREFVNQLGALQGAGDGGLRGGRRSHAVLPRPGSVAIRSFATAAVATASVAAASVVLNMAKKFTLQRQ